MIHRRFRLAVLESLLALLVACSGPTPDEVLVAARAALSKGQIRTAENNLKDLLQREPRNADARALLGHVSLRLGDVAGAEQSLRRALQLGASPRDVQLDLLRALGAQRKYKELIEQHDAEPPLAGDDQAFALTLVGIARRELRDFDAAEAAFRAALAITPRSPEARTELATAYLRRGRREDALDLIAEVLSDEPHFVPALMLRGGAEIQSARYRAAEATFEEVIRLLEAAGRRQTSEFVSALSRLIEVLIMQGSIGEASAKSDELFALSRNAAARYLRAKIEFERGNLDGAERGLESIISDAPGYWPAYTLLGAVSARRDKRGLTELYLRTSLSNRPDDSNARVLLAEMFLRQGNLESAKGLFIGQAVPENVFLALIGRAGVQAGEGFPALAYLETERSSSLQELVGLGSAYVAAGEFDRAIHAIEGQSVVEIESGGIADFLQALMQLQQGDFSAAEATANGLAAAFPNAIWSANLSGTVALVSGDYATARALFSRTLEIDPTYVPALLNSARAALALEDREAAAAHLLRVIEINPEQPTALLGLARLAEDRRDFAEARSWLERMSDSAARERLDDLGVGQR